MSKAAARRKRRGARTHCAMRNARRPPEAPAAPGLLLSIPSAVATLRFSPARATNTDSMQRDSSPNFYAIEIALGNDSGYALQIAASALSPIVSKLPLKIFSPTRVTSWFVACSNKNRRGAGVI
jgi:hypothetical protein